MNEENETIRDETIIESDESDVEMPKIVKRGRGRPKKKK